MKKIIILCFAIFIVCAGCAAFQKHIGTDNSSENRKVPISHFTAFLTFRYPRNLTS